MYSGITQSMARYSAYSRAVLKVSLWKMTNTKILIDMKLYEIVDG